MWSLVGHEQAAARLKRSLEMGRVAHAYLITGPSRVGKTTFALRLAQALNCPSPNPPCLACRVCTRIESGAHADVRLVQLGLAAGDDEAESDRARQGSAPKVIGIDQVRSIQRDAALAAHEGGYKVYVIVNAENLSTDAANSLLKLLEEPPPRVVLILTAPDANMLLPTVVSRCQPIRLQPVAAATIAAHLVQTHGVERRQAELLARLSGGRVGWAIAAATDEAYLAERATVLDRLTRVIDAGPVERFEVASAMAADFTRERAAVYYALDLWSTWWRDVLLVQAQAEDLVTNQDRLEALRRQAGRWSPARTRAYLGQIEIARTQLEQNVNPRLALEGLLLNIPGRHVN